GLTPWLLTIAPSGLKQARHGHHVPIYRAYLCVTSRHSVSGVWPTGAKGVDFTQLGRDRRQGAHRPTDLVFEILWIGLGTQIDR
ncbi:MAG: hypothetical protein ACM359_17080, partial [Bacillota bacterium]